jgi:hypothetical protein
MKRTNNIEKWTRLREFIGHIIENNPDERHTKTNTRRMIREGRRIDNRKDNSH